MHRNPSNPRSQSSVGYEEVQSDGPGQPRDHDHAGPFEQAPPTGDFPPPPTPENGATRRVIAWVTGAVVLVAVIIAVMMLALPIVVPHTPPAPQPNIEITNFTVVDRRPPVCFTGGFVDYAFTLENTGGAGFATVGYRIDGQILGNSTYYVGQNSQTPVSYSVELHDCNNHQASVGILNQTAA